MRQLLPRPAEIDPVLAYLGTHRPGAETRPWLTVGMAASLDGATATDGVSGGIGGEADKIVFRAVRAIADVILVAAGTVRAEGYRRVRQSPEVTQARVDAGRSSLPPRLAIVTRSLDLDLESDVFAPDARRPIVFTTDDADDNRVAAVAERAEVRRCGAGDVDLTRALSSLHAEGVGVVVSEGGPTLNGALVGHGLVDEWCLSIAPLVAGGESHRITNHAPATSVALVLESLLTQDDVLFGRWVTQEAASRRG